MVIRSAIYIGAGILLVVLIGIVNTRFGTHLDPAWVLVCAAAFAWPAELSPISGIIFGLILDALTGTFGFYTISYGGFGAILMALRRFFYLRGFILAWVVCLIGAELLWLFFGVFARAINMLGGNASVPGYISPFILWTVPVGFPLAWLFAQALLKPKEEQSGGYHYGATVRIIDKT